MTKWRKEIKLTHLFTEQEDYEGIQKSMNAVADVLEKEMPGFDCSEFRKIPNLSDEIALDFANRLINKMYDFADDNLIWIGGANDEKT